MWDYKNYLNKFLISIQNIESIVSLQLNVL